MTHKIKSIESNYQIMLNPINSNLQFSTKIKTINLWASENKNADKIYKRIMIKNYNLTNRLS